MARPLFGTRLAPGHRTVVAATCTRCGELKLGAAFERVPRLPGAPAYLDRRCRSCRWATAEASPGRNGVR
jgi:hypothetical protein